LILGISVSIGKLGAGQEISKNQKFKISKNQKFKMTTKISILPLDPHMVIR
jgi:hypothetical protein